MEERLGLDTFLGLLSQHWVSAFFLALTLTTILLLVIVRWWLRRRWKRLLEQQFEEESELDVLPSPGPLDLKAQEVIKQFRQEVWDLPDTDLQLNIETLSQRALRIIRSIGGVYHPEAEVPQYEASLNESLQLIRRVATRLTRLLSTVPFKYLGDRRLSDYQRYYQVYRMINENPVMKVLKRHPYLQRVARLALNIKNLANPIYWAGKELSREGYFYMVRWFYLTFTTQIGREAVRLYSGRHFQTEEDRDAALVCYRLFALARQWGGPFPSEWMALVDFVTGHAALESDTKIHILSRCSQNRLPKDLDTQKLQTVSGEKWYREGLKKLKESHPKSLPSKVHLIEEETAAPESPPPAQIEEE